MFSRMLSSQGIRVAAVSACLLFSGGPTFAQRGTSAAGVNAEIPRAVTVFIMVKDSSGASLPGSALVKLYSQITSFNVVLPTRDAGTATFPSVQPGEYFVEITAIGYRTTTDQISVLASGSSYTAYVYVPLESEPEATSAPPGAPVMTPKLQQEINKGLEKMKERQYDEAQKHFEKAASIAPGNPDVQYMMGMVQYAQQHLDAARSRFETALRIYPTHERSLVALGELQLRAGDASAAIGNLEKAYQVNGADWRTHFLLANAYAAQKDFAKAETHAERAATLGKEKKAAAQVLLGRILVAEGKKQQARAEFESVLATSPTDPAAERARSELAKLDEADSKAALAVVASPVAVAEPPAPLPVVPTVVQPWSPPDIDSHEYALAPGVSCSEEEVLSRTRQRTIRQIANFDKFLATEHIEHQEVSTTGIPGPTRAKDFTYMAFVRHMRDGKFFVDEQRDGGDNLTAFPTLLASLGLVSLGVNVFDPNYPNELSYQCEGLATWRGRAAWQIRFEQKKEVASRILTWRNSRGVFPVPLKGRVWVSASNYDVMHIETDLREPMNDLDLNLYHLMIDYGPVQFQKSKTSLWLPWHADLYLELRGKRYHHQHTFTNYTLFSVDTNDRINVPKPQSEPEPDARPSQDPPKAPSN